MLFVVWCLLFVVCRWLLSAVVGGCVIWCSVLFDVVRCVLVCCWLLVVCCWSLGVRCVLFVVCCVLLVVCCLHCSLFVVVICCL